MSSMSRSCSDLPTLKPCAARNVFAMPPPTISWSTFDSSVSSTVSLVDTFEPPTIASNGRAGFSSAVSSAVSSLTSNGPAQATGAYFATPCVLASARCAVPKASITKTSQSAAIVRDSCSSSFFSPSLKRTFSSSTTSPGATATPSSQSRFSGVGTPSSCVSRRPPEPGENSSANLPSCGRPRCDITMTRACAVERGLDGGQRGADARIAPDLAVLDGHVQILADQHALALQIEARSF